jgi:hypothetical protein
MLDEVPIAEFRVTGNPPKESTHGSTEDGRVRTHWEVGRD